MVRSSENELCGWRCNLQLFNVVPVFFSGLCVASLLLYFDSYRPFGGKKLNMQTRSQREVTVWRISQRARLRIWMTLNIWCDCSQALWSLHQKQLHPWDFVFALHCLEFTVDDAINQKSCSQLEFFGQKALSQWVRSRQDRPIQANGEANKSATAQCNGMCWRDQNRKLAVSTISKTGGVGRERIKCCSGCWKFLLWHSLGNLCPNSLYPSRIVFRCRLVKLVWVVLAHSLHCSSRWTSFKCSSVSKHWLWWATVCSFWKWILPGEQPHINLTSCPALYYC